MNTKDASDLFELQLKFENCLRLLAKKHKELSKKLSSNLDDKKDEKLKISDMGERRSSSEGKPYKKIKLASEKSQKSSLSARAKGKRTQPAKSQSSGFPEKSSDIPKTQKNDSNRFWAYLDCYCADITSEDVKKSSNSQKAIVQASHNHKKAVISNAKERKSKKDRSKDIDTFGQFVAHSLKRLPSVIQQQARCEIFIILQKYVNSH